MIENGQVASRLSSITELTAQTGVAVGTARLRIDILANEGRFQTVPGPEPS